MSFPANQLFCMIDFETYSEANLRKCGAHEYSMHPSTEVLCAAWRIGTRETIATAPTRVYAPAKGQGSDGTGHQNMVLTLLRDDLIFAAHNAGFEQCIVKNVIGRKIASHSLQNIPPSRWVCSAAMAAVLALPRKLEDAALALKLKNQKDMAGHRLMLKFSKPRKPSKHNPAIRHSDPEEHARLVAYCVQDVDTQVELFLRCPPLTAKERQIWELDQKINQHGFAVDRPLVTTVLKMVAEETKALNKETKRLTRGVLTSATKRAQVLTWLEDQGIYLPNLQKKTVEDTIAEGLVTGDTKRMLEIRQAISKTSTAKYHAFDAKSRSDGRLRDILVYHGASTGRWAGSGINPQNFPRGSIPDSTEACDVISGGDLDMIRLCYGDPMETFASCLRGMIIAPPGKTLDVGDYSAIEARVLFWFAKDEAGLKAFREGRDLYRELATKIFSVKLGSVDDKQRFVGKQATLGCGFGMGAKKFRGTCANLGQDVTDDVASLAVTAYRNAHPTVVQLWGLIERAAQAAVQNPGKKYTINRTKWWVKGKYLWCKLPSGRRLAYREPSVQYDLTPWGDKRPVLYHWGVNPKTKKWGRDKTWGGVLVENIVQATARDVMAEAMLRINATGHWDIVLSVHDELAGERPDFRPFGGKDQQTFCELMEELPDWAEGLPVKVAGWSGKRYRK